MESISQFTTDLKTLETNIFNVTTYLEALDNNNSISEDLTSLISSTEVSNLINSITSNVKLLSEYFEPLIKMAKIEYYKHQNSQTMEQYARFSIDPKEPIKEFNPKPVFVSYDELLKTHPVKPIKRRVEFNFNGTCPHCGAPKEYIYNNNHKNQFMCKVCSGAFSVHPTYNDEISLRCPYCSYKLSLRHERTDYDVLICQNDKCSFYLNNLKKVHSGNGEDLRVNKSFYKLRYTYRSFDFSLNDVNNSKSFSIKPKINLSSIRHSKWTLGLILTYYVNYGLSARKTSRILKEIHGIDVSYQTVFNYIEAVTAITENMNSNFKYNLSNTTTFDETYIKVNGKNTYVFFGSDTNSKIITSYRVFPHRTAKNAIITLKESYDKFKITPNDWTVISDANPIYNAAQLFFKMNNINFDLHQVIGVSNKDEISKKYRPQKQVEERLNRTYKQNYYGTFGYGSIRNANVFMSIWVTFYNFLRYHSTIKNTPIVLDELFNYSLMPDKWMKLIEIAKSY